MKERPILFNGENVRRILAGTKTQTRRVMKAQPREFLDAIERYDTETEHTGLWDFFDESHGWQYDPALVLSARCPYGVPGDRLWIRETFIASRGVGGFAPGVDPDKDKDAFEKSIDVIYRADDGPNERGAVGWKPSIHMPRRASRILLEVAAIRVERLQEITEADILAEGLRVPASEDGPLLSVAGPKKHYAIEYLDDPKSADIYAVLRAEWAASWDNINAKRGYGWEKNPWVWVVEFKRKGD